MAPSVLAATVAVLSLVLPLLASLALAPASATSTYLCKGYAACQKAGYSHAGYDKAGSTMWWRMYTGHNCTNYAAYRMVRNGLPNTRPWTGEGNATHWGVAMASITDSTPMVGAIAWWRKGTAGGSSGHVAYVEQVVSATEIVVSEDSWGGDFSWRRIRSGKSWPDGFIHFNDIPVRNTAAPAVAGAPTVGQALTAQGGSWTPAATLSYQWRVAGKAVAGATARTFTPAPSHLGRKITVRVVARATGYVNGAVISPASAAVAPGTLRQLTAPVIDGVAEVDRTLTLVPGSYDQALSSSSIRWLADGEPIAGATGTSVTLGQAEIGKVVTAEVTSRATGYRDAVAVTPATDPVLAGTIELARPYGIVGEARRGQVLSVDPGVVEPADAAASYTWLRDGEPTGVTGERYRLRPADVGRRISLRVDLSRTHYRSLSVTTKATRKVATDARIRLRAAGGPERVVARIRVVAPGVPAPRGPIELRVGSTTQTLRYAGRPLRVVVPDVRPGTRRVAVRWAGTALTSAATATTSVEVARAR